MNTVKQVDGYEYAGFWIRVGASLIDAGLIVSIIAYPLTEIYGKDYFLPKDNAPLIQGWADFFLSWVFPAVATLAFWLWRCATPGKMAIRALIVDAQTGERPTPFQFIIRYVAYFVSVLPIGLGILWIAWDKRRQGWHDKLAGTVVVREKHRGPLPVSFGSPGTGP